jgi:trimeric autotransporter adhesin
MLKDQAATAAGISSHAEGHNTLTVFSYSHAEGSFTTASGVASHAEGYGTKTIR